jgi:hypothetical protein
VKAHPLCGSTYLPLIFAALPLIAFVWLVFAENYVMAALPFAVSLLLFGGPIGGLLARRFKSREAVYAVVIAWFVLLLTVGMVYLGWALGLPFG